MKTEQRVLSIYINLPIIILNKFETIIKYVEKNPYDTIYQSQFINVLKSFKFDLATCVIIIFFFMKFNPKIWKFNEATQLLSNIILLLRNEGNKRRPPESRLRSINRETVSIL